MALELAGEADPWGKVPVGTVGGSHGHTGQASRRSGSTSAQDAQGTPSVDRTAQLKKRQMSVSLLVAWLGYTDAHSQLGEPRTATGWLSNLCVASCLELTCGLGRFCDHRQRCGSCCCCCCCSRRTVAQAEKRDDQRELHRGDNGASCEERLYIGVRRDRDRDR